MIVQEKNVIREITPLSEKDCFYIADRRKSEFTYPMHCHKEFELNFVINAPGVLRIVGDSAEVIGDYDLVLITSPDLEPRVQDVRQSAKRLVFPGFRHYESLFHPRQAARYERLLCRNQLPYLII